MKIIDVLLVNDQLRDKSRMQAVIWFNNGDRLNFLSGEKIPAPVYEKLGRLAKSSYRNIPELARVQTANRIIDLFHCA
jgi:hypothetical protein